MTKPPPVRRPTGPRRPDDGLGPKGRQLLQAALQQHGAGQLAAAAQSYQQILVEHPEHPPTLNFLGLVHHQGGQPAAALGWVERAIAADSGDPSFHLCRAHVLAALNRLDDAVAACRRSLALAPDNPEALNQLGLLLIGQGRRAEARVPLARACQLQPTNAALQANLGELLRQLGELDAALAACRAAVALQPRLAEVHLLLGNVLKERGDFAGACASYDQAIRLNPKLAVAHHNGATARRAIGRLGDALAGFRAALDLEPDSIDHKTAIAACLVELPEGPSDARSHGELTRALREGWVRPESLAVTAANRLKRDPAIAALLAWSATVPADVLPALPGDAALDDPLLGALLEASTVPDPAIELLLARLRAALLGRASGAEGTAHGEFAASLAIQCFENDYLLSESAAETAPVEALAVAIEADLLAGQRPSEAAMLALASYRPLNGLTSAARLLDIVWPAVLQPVLRRQIVEPAEEARLRGQMPRFGAIEDGVSQAVRAQYEEHPYPRWTRMSLAGAAIPLREGLALEFPRLRDSLAGFPERPRILIAGCGTGWQSIVTARSYPEASVLAIDLSLTSLGYALRKTRELGIATIEYRQADILALGTLDARFEVIEAGGVLHHLADPLQGWRVLRGLLQPAGIMRVSLYSELGRRSVVAARALIAARGYGADPAGIRAARAMLLETLPADQLALLTRSTDFYSLSGCRDLLFHVQEHRFTLPQIAAALAALDLELVGFVHTSPLIPQRYREANPDDPDMVDLAGWDRFEQANPDTFGGMYNMCLRACRRPDGSGDG